MNIIIHPSLLRELGRTLSFARCWTNDFFLVAGSTGLANSLKYSICRGEIGHRKRSFCNHPRAELITVMKE